MKFRIAAQCGFLVEGKFESSLESVFATNKVLKTLCEPGC